MPSRLREDQLDNLLVATQDLHKRKLFNGIFYQSEFRTGRFGEPGPGVILDDLGLNIYNAFGIRVGLFDLDGSLWIPKTGVLTKVQTFDDGSGHNVLYI